MSLFASLFSGVAGINSQSSAIASFSDNISNVNTVGFKVRETTFSSLVTGTGGTGGSGGALARGRTAVDEQGLILPTGVATDMAIDGGGFFVVTDKAEKDSGEEFLYTRAGSFRQDNRGNFVNAAGYFLRAWPLDNEGRLPGELGNIDTTPFARLDSLETVNFRGSNVAQATTKVDLGLNLDAEQQVLQGAGLLIDFPATSENGGTLFSSRSIIVPQGIAAPLGGLSAGDVLEISVTNPPATTYSFTYGGWAQTDAPISAGNTMFGSSTPGGAFTLGATDEGDIMRITTDTYGAFDFELSSSPDPLNGTFNSVLTLVEAINNTNGLVARVDASNNLFISSRNANDSLTIENVDGVNGGGAADVVTALFGAGNATTSPATVVAASVATIAAGTDRFNTLEGLQTIIATKEGIASQIESSGSDPQMTIYATDPLGTITFADNAANNGHFVEAGLFTEPEFGFTATAEGPVYDPLDGAAGDNMASGSVVPHFGRSVRVFDSLGVGHDIRISVVKIDNNKWAIEMYAANPDEVVSSRTDGLLSYGTITFNGDGSLRNIPPLLLNNIEINWSNEALASTLEFDFGTAGQPLGTDGATEFGLTDGLSQFAGNYDVRFIDQNGAGAGLLTSVEIDEDGFIIANFSNGESRAVYKVPLADFPNVNGLQENSGNAYSQGSKSGDVTLKEAGESGVGSVAAAALENSGTELSQELTNLIISQRGYQANTRTISTADQLLEELANILR